MGSWFAKAIVLFPALSLAAVALAGEEESVQLESCQLGAIKPAHLIGDIYLTGQPEQEDLKDAHRLGMKSVLNLRESDEVEWDEAEAVKALGMNYHHLPISGPDDLTDEVFGKVRRILNDPKQRPVLVHCGSANRVGAVWVAHRVLDGGVSVEQAFQEAKEVGLRNPEMEAKAKAHIEAQRNKSRNSP